MTIPLRVLAVLMAMSTIAGGCGYALGSEIFRSTVVYSDPRRFHEWELSDPWERCLAAMESAEIPGWMWECREHE